ncbi:MAG TPA: HAD hydrolase family protein [Actinomycetes bacterium]|nr:HAD hydrolase family protein [Actinomycetes bacterium]
MAVALADAGRTLEALAPAVLFSDVDGTLVGRGGSLLADLDGTPTLAAAEALVAARRAGLEVVLVSGRTRAQLFETGRLLGLRDAIAEMGAVLLRDGRAELQWGETPRDLGETPAEALERSGALRTVLDRFAGRIEPHAPWHQNRQGTALLRGQVEVAEVDAALAAEGLGWARLLDNGRLRGPYPHLGPGETHAYHLLPAAVSKAATAAAYLAARGLGPRQAAAVGDGPADLELADAVGAMFLVANGAWAAAEAGERQVVVTQSSAGRGVAEVVRALCTARQA